MVALGMALRWIAGLLGFVWGIIVVWDIAGLLGVVAGFLLAPITLTLAPLYAALAWGAWVQFLVPLGLAIVGYALIAAGSRDDESGAPRGMI